VGKASGGAFWGLALLIIGAVWLLNNTGVLYFDFGDFVSRAWPAVIILIGLWMLFGSGNRRVVTRVDSSETVSHGFGDVDMSPGEIGEEGLHINVSAGEIHLDLGGTRFPERENHVHVKLGLGDVKVTVPRDLPVKVEARTGIGDLHVLDNHRDGFGVKLDFQDADYGTARRKLMLVAKAGLGDVTIKRKG
jgi:lia operon protein LiaF